MKKERAVPGGRLSDRQAQEIQALREFLGNGKQLSMPKFLDVLIDRFRHIDHGNRRMQIYIGEQSIEKISELAAALLTANGVQKEFKNTSPADGWVTITW